MLLGIALGAAAAFNAVPKVGTRDMPFTPELIPVTSLKVLLRMEGDTTFVRTTGGEWLEVQSSSEQPNRLVLISRSAPDRRFALDTDFSSVDVKDPGMMDRVFGDARWERRVQPL